MNIIDEWRDYCAVQERILELLKQKNTALAEIEKLASYLSGKEDVLSAEEPPTGHADDMSDGLELIRKAQDNNHRIQSLISQLRLNVLRENQSQQYHEQRLKQTLGAYHQPDPSSPRFIDRHR